jgi:hypothetical protein
MREDDVAFNAGLDFFDQMRIRREGARRPVSKPGTSTDAEEMVYLDGPGRFAIEFPALQGFDPIEPRTVDVAQGQTVELTIGLKRAH